ncbi:MAG: hypothetical protein WDZ84_05225 [Rhodovibrionaceae bacterium]
MYGYYILEDQNPALLERQKLRNEARAAAFYAALKPLREGLAECAAVSVAAAGNAIAFLMARIRTSLLSWKRLASTYEPGRR